jgi:low affinity Fe/Cu permease
MVFLIQNSQNRDTEAIQLKLDELIRANKRARNGLLNLEDLTEDQLQRVKDNFHKLAESSPDAAEATLVLDQAQRSISSLAGRRGHLSNKR